MKFTGPGCSSLGYGAFEELGPFRINSDGKTLYRNKYAWNEGASPSLSNRAQALSLFFPNSFEVPFFFVSLQIHVLQNRDFVVEVPIMKSRFFFHGKNRYQNHNSVTFFGFRKPQRNVIPLWLWKNNTAEL